MADQDLSVDSLDTCLVELQLGEATLERFSQSLMRTRNEEEEENGEVNQVTREKQEFQRLHPNNLNTAFSSKWLDGSSSIKNVENSINYNETYLSLSQVPVLDINNNHTVNPSPIPRNNIPSVSSASSENEKIPEYLDALNELVDQILANGGGVRESLRSEELPYLGVTPEHSEMLLQHGEFPATPGFTPIPSNWSTPMYTIEEKMKMNGNHGYNAPCKRPTTQPVRSFSPSFNEGITDNTYAMRGDSLVHSHPSIMMVTPENEYQKDQLPKCNFSSDTSLPSIISWGVGEGEGAWSSMSQTSSAWGSATATLGSGQSTMSQYFTPPGQCNDWSSSYEANSELNRVFYQNQDYKSCSYPELLSQQRAVEGSLSQINETAHKFDNCNTKLDPQGRSRIRFYPYPVNNTYPRIDSTGYHNLQAADLRKQKENLQGKQGGQHWANFPCNPSVIKPPKSHDKLKISRTLAKPNSSTPLPQNLRRPKPQTTTKAAVLTSPRKTLLQDVVLKESTMAFRSHPLFPLLHDLAVTDYYYENAPFNISSLLLLLPPSTNDLISMFLRRYPDNAFSYRTATNCNSAIDSVIRDAIKYAHSCLLANIQKQISKNPGPLQDECEKEVVVEKMCLKYVEAVRSSTPAPVMQTLGPVGQVFTRETASSGNPFNDFNRMLEVFSPIPPSREILESTSSLILPNDKSENNFRYTKEAVEVLSRWLRDHQERPYPDDDQKLHLMSKTGLSSKQLTEWFANVKT